MASSIRSALSTGASKVWEFFLFLYQGGHARRGLALLWLFMFFYPFLFLALTMVWAFTYYSLLEASIRVAIASYLAVAWVFKRVWEVGKAAMEDDRPWQLHVADAFLIIVTPLVYGLVPWLVLTLGSGKF